MCTIFLIHTASTRKGDLTYGDQINHLLTCRRRAEVTGDTTNRGKSEKDHQKFRICEDFKTMFLQKKKKKKAPEHQNHRPRSQCYGWYMKQKRGPLARNTTIYKPNQSQITLGYMKRQHNEWWYIVTQGDKLSLKAWKQKRLQGERWRLMNGYHLTKSFLTHTVIYYINKYKSWLFIS